MSLMQSLNDWIAGSSIDDVRKILTPLFITLDTVLCGVFSGYALIHYKELPFKENLPVQAALALDTYFFGQLLTRIWGYLVLFVPTDNDGVQITLQWDFGLIFATLGSVVAVIGAAWITYVFTPKNWRASWFIAATAVGMFVALTWRF